MKELSSFTGTYVESLFRDQSLTIPPAQQVGSKTTDCPFALCPIDLGLLRFLYLLGSQFSAQELAHLGFGQHVAEFYILRDLVRG